MITKKLKTMWGNGIGVVPVLWFPHPEKYLWHPRFSFWVPVKQFNQYKSYFDGHAGGGRWIPKKGISHSSNCIVCLSEDRNFVHQFTESIKRELKHPIFWQEGLLKEIRRIQRHFKSKD